MASDPSLAIQGALVALLKSLGTAAGNNVFDSVPSSNPFPRITVGQAQAVPVMADCYDGTESTIQIDGWSRSPGYPEVKGIGDAIRTALNEGSLTITGHKLELMSVESVDYSRDPDGLTSRARIIVRMQTQPTT